MDISVEEITHHASWVLILFLLGYTAIVAEQWVKINKSAIALLMAIGCWTVLFLEPEESVERHSYIFGLQLYKVSQIMFFLLGALAIVEIINVHNGFQIITKNLNIRSKRRMLWVSGFITFFLSGVLDNLTTTIVMVSLISKLIDDREERMMMGGMIVIAANVGGAWTPIGDVATTLLWINGQITALAVVRDLFIPSICGLAACLLWFTSKFKGDFKASGVDFQNLQSAPGSVLVLILGVASLIFVPFFKVMTGLPAFMGMMLGLGILWIVTDLLHYKYAERENLRVLYILPKVDFSILLFYLGVLLSINALESAGLLRKMSEWLNLNVAYPLVVPVIVGLVSSVVDNVSLVAGVIGMYPLTQVVPDSKFWQMVAYAAGTGGSILVVGSAAGVALMALEKVDFVWYTKKITIPALLCYFVGLGVYFLVAPFTKGISF